MSADPDWFLVPVPPERVDEIAARFQRAAEMSKLADDDLHALAEWERDPEAAIASDLMRRWSPFITVGFERLACELFAEESSIIKDGDGPLELVSTNRIPPTLVLWCGLGPARAKQLPGFFGNLFLRPEEVADARIRIDRAFDLSDADFHRRASGAIAWGNNSEDDLPKIRAALPSAIAKAAERGCGLLALCANQITEPWWLEKREVVHSGLIPSVHAVPDGANEAARIRARLDSGELPRACVELAAHIGHEASRAALGDPRDPVHDVAELCRSLSYWGNEPYLRALAAMTRLLLTDWVDGLHEIDPSWKALLPMFGGGDDISGDEPRVAIEAAEACLRNPSPANRASATRASDAVHIATNAMATVGQGIHRAFQAARAAGHLAQLASYYDPLGDDVSGGLASSTPSTAADRAGVDRVRRAIQEALIPWVLGYEDPLDHA